MGLDSDEEMEKEEENLTAGQLLQQFLDLSLVTSLEPHNLPSIGGALRRCHFKLFSYFHCVLSLYIWVRMCLYMSVFGGSVYGSKLPK